MLKALFRLSFGTLLALHTATSQAEPTPQNTLSIQGQFEFASIDPTRRGYIFQRMQVVETLMNVDPQGNLSAGLAQRWALSDDGLQWTFTLQPDVRFHNGTQMDAESVVNSLRIALSKPGPLQAAPVEAITALDAQRVQITLTTPYRPLGAILANYSTAILAPASFDAQGQVTDLIGSGPFSAYEIAIPHKLTVERFADYWGKKATLEYASYLTGHRAETRVLQARSGRTDIVLGLNATAATGLQRLPHINIIKGQQPRALALKLNLAHPLLAPRPHREALSLAINRPGIATAVLRNPELASSQLLPPYMNNWFLQNTHSKPSLLRATQLLSKQGWEKDADGWLQRDGQRFELTLITYADRPELLTVATAIQDQWQKLGVKLNVNITNSSAIPAGHHDGSLEVALIARNYGTIADPAGVIMRDFGHPGGGDWGSMNWDAPAIQATLNQMMGETDPVRYKQQAQQVAQAIHTEKPLIAIAYYVQNIAVNRRVNGFRFDPFERTYYLNDIEWNR